MSHEKSSLNELQRALARPDIAELSSDVVVFVSTQGWQRCETNEDWEAFDRWMGADAERMMSYVALVADGVSDLDCVASASICHLDNLLHLVDASSDNENLQLIFERILHAARTDMKWRTMVQTAAWFHLSPARRAAVVKAAEIPD